MSDSRAASRAPVSPAAGAAWRTWALAGSCTILLVAGCAGGSSAGAGVPAKHAPTATPPDAAASSRVLAARYLAIAQAGNRRLDHDFDALDGRDRDHLAAADADLRDIARTERLFDQRLGSITFPPATEKTARQLITVNQARSRLTQIVASSTSVPQLRRYLPLLTRANQPVEAAVRLIRSRLGLPPPQTS